MSGSFAARSPGAAFSASVGVLRRVLGSEHRLADAQLFLRLAAWSFFPGTTALIWRLRR